MFGLRQGLRDSVAAAAGYRRGAEGDAGGGGGGREPERSAPCRATQGEPSHLAAQSDPSSCSGCCAESPQTKAKPYRGVYQKGVYLRFWKRVHLCGSRLNAISRMRCSWWEF